MKLTNEDKIKIYNLKQEGYSYRELTKKYQVRTERIKYIVALADVYGEEILIKGKNNHYPKEIKEQIINEVLLENKSLHSTALKYALSSVGMLSNWVSKFKENRYNILEKPKGRPRKMRKETKQETQKLSKIEQLEKENEYLRAEVAVLKKLQEIRLKQSQTKKKRK